MQLSQIPLRMLKAWAVGAGGSYIRTVPVASQIGISDGAASFNDGFVPDNFTPVASGGVPPFGQDMNGALNAITSWDQWVQAGGAIGYDATFSTGVGGYPKGCILDSNVTPGAQWCSTVDNNTTNPDDPLTSANWIRVGLQPGMPSPILGTTGGGQFISANGTTVGSNASGSAQAADTYLFVYKTIWDQFSNTQCPIFDSAGAASTRGANAVADFNANKRLTTPNMKGLGVIGVDTMGGSASSFLSGVPVSIGNTTTPGSILGETLHSLIAGEIPVINSSAVNSITVTTNRSDLALGNSPSTTGGGGFAINTVTTFGAVSSTGNNTISVTSTNAGAGAHNNVSRNMAVYWGLKI